VIAAETAFAAVEARSGYGVANSEVAFRDDAANVVAVVAASLILEGVVEDLGIDAVNREPKGLADGLPGSMSCGVA
jgi:hypothetical protein